MRKLNQPKYTVVSMNQGQREMTLWGRLSNLKSKVSESRLGDILPNNDRPA